MGKQEEGGKGSPHTWPPSGSVIQLSNHKPMTRGNEDAGDTLTSLQESRSHQSPQLSHQREERLLSRQARRWNLQIGKLQVAATWEAKVPRRLLPRSSACQFQLSQQVPQACGLSCFSRVWLCATLWTVTLQAPLSTGFSRQEYWSGMLCPPPGDLQPREQIHVSYVSFTGSGCFTISATREAPASPDILSNKSPIWSL